MDIRALPRTSLGLLAVIVSIGVAACRPEPAAPSAPPSVDVVAEYRRWAEARIDETWASLPPASREDLAARDGIAAADRGVAEGTSPSRAELIDRVRVRDLFHRFVDAWLSDGAAGPVVAGVNLAERLRSGPASAEAEAVRTRLRRRLSRSGPAGWGGTVSHDAVVMEVWLIDWFASGYERVEGLFRWTPEVEWELRAIDASPVDPPRDSKPPDTTESVPSGGAADLDRVSRQACRQCDGIRFGRPGTPWTTLDVRVGCAHEWHDGASSAVPRSQRDGTVVLLRRGTEFGAFRMERQLEDPECVTYTWIVRDDGGTLLDPEDPATRHGRVERATRIVVGSMSVEWSIASKGVGWIYHDRPPASEATDRDILLCVTDLADWRGADAADQRWEYRAARGDPPVTGR